MSCIEYSSFFTEIFMEEILRNGFAELGIVPDEKAIGRYREYYEYLEQQNKVMNLTAISGEENVAKLHFLDCAALLGFCDMSGKSVIDVGTGAGFPGLALKIAEPDIGLTLLDSLNKRIDFLSETCRRLGLTDVTCVHARAEEPPESFRAGFDIASSRAVARLNVLCELCLPLVKVGGLFIAMKGPDCTDELNEATNAIHLLGAELQRTVSYTIPGTDIVHTAVIIKKIKPTHPKYPRKWSQIKKQPL